MQFELTSDETAAAQVLMQAHWAKPEQAPRSSMRTIGLWVICIALFIAFYQVFQHRPDEPEEAPAPTPVAPYGVIDWAALAVFGVGAAAVVWAMKSKQQRLTPSKTVGADVSSDGLEIRLVKVTSIHPWSDIADVLEGSSVFLVRLKNLQVLTLPKRIFDEAQRAEIAKALAQRGSPRAPEGLDAEKYEVRLTKAQVSQVKRFSRRFRSNAWKVLLVGLAAVMLSTALLASRQSTAWVFLSVLSGLMLSWFGVTLVRALTKLPVMTFQLGAAGMRWISPNGGCQMSWEQVEAWTEAADMLMIRAYDRVVVVPQPSVPGATYRLIRERLPRQISMLVLAGLVGMLSSCSAARIRTQAALALSCPEVEVSVQEKGPGAWAASGCGKTTTCGLSSTDGAEPHCVTGIPKPESAR